MRSVRLLTSSRAIRLERDGTGRVDAVVVDMPDGRRRVAARRNVVLASGGFTRNRDLMFNFGGPESLRLMPISGAGSRGDGLIMAMGLGAATSFISAGVAPTGPVEPISGKGSLIAYGGAVLLNSKGRRFANEAAMYSEVSRTALKQNDATIFQIYDDAVRETYSRSMWGRVLTGFPEFKADSLGELLDRIAREHRFDAEAARDALLKYNEYVGQGNDPEFGRNHLVGETGRPTPIARPPFYGVVTVPGTTQNNGGLKVDGDLRVVDVFGDPINGLYAAGEIIGGFHGNGYLAGTHIGMALVFGQIAGRKAAA